MPAEIASALEAVAVIPWAQTGRDPEPPEFVFEDQQTIPIELTRKELELFRVWYDAVSDTCPKYLEQKDHDLMFKVMEILNKI